MAAKYAILKILTCVKVEVSMMNNSKVTERKLKKCMTPTKPKQDYNLFSKQAVS